MNVSVDTIHNTPVVRVSGEVDMSNIRQIEDRLGGSVTNEAFAVIVDLSDCAYLDSAGIRLLYQLDSRVRSRQQRLVIIVPKDSVINRTLEASGTIGALKIVRTQDDAFAELSA
jgi:anti-anti-sigma factor